MMMVFQKYLKVWILIIQKHLIFLDLNGEAILVLMKKVIMQDNGIIKIQEGEKDTIPTLIIQHTVERNIMTIPIKMVKNGVCMKMERLSQVMDICLMQKLKMESKTNANI
jgi:hypothetical protein